jgi:8-oxo-dGTP pyrophosphatase MutT (NUDIX family)
MLDLAERPSDTFSREHFDPGHFTASSFVLSPDGSALLLILHGKLQRWLQPGGHVDPDDPDILAAALREVREEVGIERLDVYGGGIFDVDVHEIPPLRGDPAHAHFDVRFAFRAHDLHAIAASDAQAVRWVQLREIDEASSDRSVMRAVEKLLAR